MLIHWRQLSNIYSDDDTAAANYNDTNDDDT